MKTFDSVIATETGSLDSAVDEIKVMNSLKLGVGLVFSAGGCLKVFFL